MSPEDAPLDALLKAHLPSYLNSFPRRHQRAVEILQGLLADDPDYDVEKHLRILAVFPFAVADLFQAALKKAKSEAGRLAAAHIRHRTKKDAVTGKFCRR